MSKLTPEREKEIREYLLAAQNLDSNSNDRYRIEDLIQGIDFLRDENARLWKEQSALLDQIARMNEVHEAKIRVLTEQRDRARDE